VRSSPDEEIDVNVRALIYWVSTALFCTVLGFSGFSHLTHAAFVSEAMAELGYPAYVMTILGTAKLLGVAALLAPGRPLAKEWAYAGFSINLLGATASHLFAGDPIVVAARPAVILLLGAASYLTRPAARRIPSAPTLGEASLSTRPAGAAGQS
jgi:hypothetical protein